MFEIRSGFIGDFKTGDNINYNLGVLEVLYIAQEEGSADDRDLFCKPIILGIASIVEALMHDLFWRMRYQNVESAATVARGVLDDVQNKQIDQYAVYVDVAKKHALLGNAEDEIYEHLHMLRRRRNRIHIQNLKRDLDPDEANVFTQDVQEEAEKLLESVAKLVAAKFPRPDQFAEYVDDFVLPWKEHL